VSALDNAAITAARQPAHQPSGVIVIVDDEMMVTSSLQTMLQLQTPHRIYCFNHPQEALTQLPQLQPELVISDFSMPGMDGIQFLTQVRQMLPEATLMLLTGYADKESAIAAINTVGIYRYLEKPWDNSELKINIENGLERSRLVSDLRRSVLELEATQEKLAEANLHLEGLVTARTQALQGAYQTLSSIVNNTTDGIVTLDADLRLQSFNPAVERWFRQVEVLRQGNLTELDIEQWLLSEQPGQTVRQYFASGHACRVDDLRIGDLPVEASISPLHGRDNAEPSADDGPPRGFVLVLRDITARREVERLRDDFVSTLTHDLRTPLLAAIQTLGFFADGTLGALSQRQKDLVTMLISSHKDMLELVNVLLDVYRYEAGNQQLLLDKVNPWDLLTLTVKELTALAQSREQSLSIESSEELLSLESLAVQGDKRELKRVLVNLIGNAIHYTPRGGTLLVRLDILREKHCVKITVQDNGRGIPASDLPVLFQRFSQGTSRQRSSGSGLGLYLSRQIVEAHHGRIWVESEENAGSRFYVELPLLRP
jgi:signal transduction histidine kinase/DNA-binding NarL/FixJ family response regulator